MTAYEERYARLVRALNGPDEATCAECGVPLSPATILSCCSQCLIVEALDGLRR